MERPEDCITFRDCVEFLKSAGNSPAGYLGLLNVYLSCGTSEFCTIDIMRTMFKDKIYIQVDGVSIVSAVSPVLSNLFLASVRERISMNLEGDVGKIFRYVYRHLVFHTAIGTRFHLQGARPVFFPIIHN